MKSKLTVIFFVSMAIGGGMEMFCIRTGLYNPVVANKAQRRYDLDEFVVKFRKDVQTWTEEDMRRAGTLPAKE